MKLDLVQGDITAQRVDAVVNPANSSLLAECRALRASRYGRGMRGAWTRVGHALLVLYSVELLGTAQRVAGT